MLIKEKIWTTKNTSFMEEKSVTLPTEGRSLVSSHHGELIQGLFADSFGQLHRALVTLPCPLFYSQTKFNPAPHQPILHDQKHAMSAQAARMTLDHAGLSSWGGRLIISSNTAVCRGLGSSTSDIMSAILAVARSFSLPMTREHVTALAIKVEVASDPLLHSQNPLLFAQREGLVLEYFDGSLPPIDVLGFDSDQYGAGVKTKTMPLPDYDWRKIELFRSLLGSFRFAIEHQDPYLLGRATTLSARINQSYLPTRNFDKLLKLTEEIGGTGFQISHSGTVCGIIFDSTDRALEEKIQSAHNALALLGINHTYRFRPNTTILEQIH